MTRKAHICSPVRVTVQRWENIAYSLPCEWRRFQQVLRHQNVRRWEEDEQCLSGCLGQYQGLGGFTDGLYEMQMGRYAADFSYRSLWGMADSFHEHVQQRIRGFCSATDHENPLYYLLSWVPFCLLASCSGHSYSVNSSMSRWGDWAQKSREAWEESQVCTRTVSIPIISNRP